MFAVRIGDWQANNSNVVQAFNLLDGPSNLFYAPYSSFGFRIDPMHGKLIAYAIAQYLAPKGDIPLRDTHDYQLGGADGTTVNINVARAFLGTIVKLYTNPRNGNPTPLLREEGFTPTGVTTEDIDNFASPALLIK